MVGTRCVGVSRWSYLAPEASDGKVLCGHKPQSKPHLSEPGTHQRTWRVMGRPARQAPQTPSMTRRNDRTRHDHAAAPLADCPFVPPSIHPTKKEPPGPNTRELSQNQTTSSPPPQLSQFPLQPIRTRLLPQCIRPLFTPTLFNPLTDSLADSLTDSLFNPLINPHLLNLKTLHICHRNLSILKHLFYFSVASAASSAPSPTDPLAPSPSTYSPSLHSAPVQSLE